PSADVLKALRPKFVRPAHSARLRHTGLIKIKGKGPIRVFLWAAFNKSGDWPMSETISRRESFSLLGLAAALGFAAPTVLTSSNAEDQKEGMERRQDRRANR